MSTSEIATVLAWHDALNSRDYGTLQGLCSEDVEFAMPDRAAQGHRALLEWAQQSSGITAETGRLYVHDGVVVAEQTMSDGDGNTSQAAASFRVVHDHITSVFHHPSLEAALAATGLTEQDLD